MRSVRCVVRLDFRLVITMVRLASCKDVMNTKYHLSLAITLAPVPDVAIIHARYCKTHLSQPSVLQWMHAVVTGYCPKTKAIVRKTPSADWTSSVALWEVIGVANRKSPTYTSALLIKLYRHVTSNISSCDWTHQHSSCDVFIPNKIVSLELSHFNDKRFDESCPNVDWPLSY